MRRFAFLLALALAACSHLDTRTPGSVDMSGTWRIDEGASDTMLPLGRPPPDRVEDEGPGPGGPPRFLGPGPLLPMLSANEMTISQDATGMGIAYPGQPYRDIKWGEQKRSLYVVTAGWQEQTLIVETDSKPVRVRETYALSDEGDTLTLAIDVHGRQGGTRHVTRVFRRAPQSSR